MNPYVILGIEVNATKEEIRIAYRLLASKHHPDKEGGDTELFKQIKEAYEILFDDDRRKQFDTTGNYKQVESNALRDRLLDQISELLLQLIDNENINFETTNLLDSVREHISRTTVNNLNQINKLNFVIDRRRRAIKHITNNTTNENLLAAILEGKVKSLENNIKALQEGVDNLQQMLAFVNEYGFEITIPTQQPTFTSVSWVS
jgi:curved DNA-binding protein CbpA